MANTASKPGGFGVGDTAGDTVGVAVGDTVGDTVTVGDGDTTGDGDGTAVRICTVASSVCPSPSVFIIFFSS